MEKWIKNYEGEYSITDDGKVISYKMKRPKVLKSWIDRQGYENIKLSKNNTTKHYLIHRLVAEAYIPNPNNSLEVNHKDFNRSNNNVSNLEWCDRRYNIENSSLGFVRNYYNCYLTDISGNIIGEFKSIKAAARYAEEHFGCSISYMQKSLTSKGYNIILKSVETKGKDKE